MLAKPAFYFSKDPVVDHDHALSSGLDEGADCFDRPDGCTGAELDAFGIASCLDTSPPGRFANGNQRGNVRSDATQNLPKAEITSFR